jgi:hypothetical protein
LDFLIFSLSLKYTSSAVLRSARDNNDEHVERAVVDVVGVVFSFFSFHRTTLVEFPLRVEEEQKAIFIFKVVVFPGKKLEGEIFRGEKDVYDGSEHERTEREEDEEKQQRQHREY